MTDRPNFAAMEPLPPIMPPWWAFWRQPEERWQVRTEDGTLGPLAHHAALDVLDMVVHGQYGLRAHAVSKP
jgi:hypothetical protein